MERNNQFEKDFAILREKFINEYAREKGWDVGSLTPMQLLEITQQPNYKNPMLIKS